MRRVIIDTDGGVDDALALLLALAWPGAQVDAITTVHGNVPVEAATRNVGEILRIAGVETTVAQGAASPLLAAAVAAREVHGFDGLGGWTAIQRPHALRVDSRPPQKLIPLLARQAPGALTLVTIGPLTNAALAAREDPEGFRMLKELVLMGGAVWEPGNVTSTAEFNIFADPEAAHEVVHSGIPTLLVGLDVTRKVVLTRERLEGALGNRSDLRARFLRHICAHMFSFYRSVLGTEMFYLHDPLAVGAALDRSFVAAVPLAVDVEASGDLTRGMVVAERRAWVRKPANVEVSTSVEAGRFLDTFCDLVLSTGAAPPA